MLCKIEETEDRSAEIHSGANYNVTAAGVQENVANGRLRDIDEAIESLKCSLWPLNRYVHKHPELAFEEFKAHNALTKYMSLHEGWQVTRSAYGLETAWTAVYDSRKSGPVVSFNAEMGTYTAHTVCLKQPDN
jgi:hypothetical protein